MKVAMLVLVSVLVVVGVARAGSDFPLPIPDNSCYDSEMTVACCVTDFTGETRCYHKVAVPFVVGELLSEPSGLPLPP